MAWCCVLPSGLLPLPASHPPSPPDPGYHIDLAQKLAGVTTFSLIDLLLFKAQPSFFEVLRKYQQLHLIWINLLSFLMPLHTPPTRGWMDGRTGGEGRKKKEEKTS